MYDRIEFKNTKDQHAIDCLKLCVLTVVINHAFISSSTVQIDDISYILLQL